MFSLVRCSCQVPANILMKKLPSNWFFAGITIVWGSVTVAFLFVSSYSDLIIARLLLGIFEAGNYSGFLFLLSQYFVAEEMASVIAVTRSVSCSHFLHTSIHTTCIAALHLLCRISLAPWRLMGCCRWTESMVCVAGN